MQIRKIYLRFYLKIEDLLLISRFKIINYVPKLDIVSLRIYNEIRFRKILF